MGQALRYLRKRSTIAAILLAFAAGACSGQAALEGRDPSSADTPAQAGSSGLNANDAQGGQDVTTAPPRALGEVCGDEIQTATFAGFNITEVNIDDGSAVCGSGLCLSNHFQGLVSCPYGQAAGGGDCLLPGSQQAVLVAVSPQLVERQAAVASICSCRCDGPGPGPFCTCPESMQCEHLVDDLGLAGTNYAGSYCIPKGSAYEYAAPRTECVEPSCGVKHPY